MRMISIAFVFAALALPDCVMVSRDKILAQDLGAAVPLLQGLDPETVIGFAPRPGVQRILTTRDLILIAQKHGLDARDAASPNICVERMARAVSPEEMKAALASAIGGSDVAIELLEFSKEPLPPGQLEFNSRNLGRPLGDNPEIPVIWHGAMRYDGQSKAPVWAKVKVSIACSLFVAAANIPAGSVIQAEQIKEIPGRQFPFLPSTIQSPQAIIGKIARRGISAGQRFATSMLEEPTEIARGDTVHVVVLDGSAILSLDAIAESSGRKGESILLHNPSTGRNFRAEVEERGRATLRSSPGA